MIGSSHTITLKVTEDKLASAVGSGLLRVFATPAMLAAMERAACGALEPYLQPGQTSVGTALNVEHTAATPLGMEVSVTAAVTGQEGRRVEFAVSARDGRGEIGRGTHTRFLVDAERFQQKADGRGASE